MVVILSLDRIKGIFYRGILYSALEVIPAH